MKALITGGAGYIGSTIASACLDSGVTPVILDDFSTGRREFVAERISYEGDIADGDLIDRIFGDHPDIDAVIHCAAKIVVPESVADPLGYYDNNVAKSVRLLQHLIRNGCGRVIFSSSASIYRPGEDFTVDERSPLDPLSPYARTKMLLEIVLEDTAAAGAMRCLSLRYFNPVGADPQLRTGPQDPFPSHVVGRLIYAMQHSEPFTVTGTDWPTRDGSAIRDYIHVWDLAQAHVAALLKFDDVVDGPSGYNVINLGTGSGTTVRELLDDFQTVAGIRLDVQESPPRPGDTVGSYTLTAKANELLGWKAQLPVRDAVRDALRWAEIRSSRLPG